MTARISTLRTVCWPRTPEIQTLWVPPALCRSSAGRGLAPSRARWQPRRGGSRPTSSSSWGIGSSPSHRAPRETARTSTGRSSPGPESWAGSRTNSRTPRAVRASSADTTMPLDVQTTAVPTGLASPTPTTRTGSPSASPGTSSSPRGPPGPRALTRVPSATRSPALHSAPPAGTVPSVGKCGTRSTAGASPTLPRRDLRRVGQATPPRRDLRRVGQATPPRRDLRRVGQAGSGRCAGMGRTAVTPGRITWPGLRTPGILSARCELGDEGGWELGRST
mmetsp:Transcript_88710/g.237272  ORF Transcript_88710/g.237272 Transcript_88710/m.237272 type:complete len:278 (-) Transcript_88710:40-873(-)